MSYSHYWQTGLTYPFNGQHVPLREYYVSHVPSGPSMLAEKLACPMEDAAHERRFMAAQRTSVMATFHDQHVSIISRSIDMMEEMFRSSCVAEDASMYSRPTTPVDPLGGVHYISDLMWQAEDWKSAAANLDFYATPEPRSGDTTQASIVDDFSTAEMQSLIEQTRRRRRSFYRKKPNDPRVNKHASLRSKSAINLRLKPRDAIQRLPKSSHGP